MEWYKWLALASLAVCLVGIISHIAKLLKLGKPKDYSAKAGNVNDAIKYSFTGAMSPKKKESAYLHLPTYTAGLIYHFGSFLSLVLILIIASNIEIDIIPTYLMSLFLLISGICGLGIFIKRIVKRELLSLSNADDFIANLLVTVFQFTTALVIYSQSHYEIYFIVISVFFLYLPISKLKHILYFFAARYQLGLFYGWRNIWPPTKA